MTYKKGKWAQEIVNKQNAQGSWTDFHSLSQPTEKALTTEQALRRLEILGYSFEDQVIKNAVTYMERCLVREIDIPDYKEKHNHWEIFVNLMLASWICRFTDQSLQANKVLQQWIDITQKTFSSGAFKQEDYNEAYKDIFGLYPDRKLATLILRFYNVSLLANKLDQKTENLFFDYVLNSNLGIYYVYDRSLKDLPSDLKTKAASRYLGAIEHLLRYKNQRYKLAFVKDWLLALSMDDHWDMGSKVKDQIYFPLSDDWRKKDNRIKDCTYRINNILEKL